MKLTKSQAAETLGVSPRSINRMIAAGRLHVSYVKSPTGGSPSAEFDSDEVEAVKNAPVPVPAKPESRALARTNGSDLAGLAETLERLLSTGKGRGTPVPAEAKLLLTLLDVASLTSLSRQRLREAIASGNLKAFRIGRGWKVRRSDLEAYISKLE